MAYKRTQFGLFLEKILAMDPDVLRAEYFRPDEGMRIYHMGRTPIMQLAEEAGALYKINRHVLINKKAFDENFEKYRVSTQDTSTLQMPIQNLNMMWQKKYLQGQ